MRRSRAHEASPTRCANEAPRGWVAHAGMLADGSPCHAGQRAKLFLFCLSVREDYSADVDDRLSLLGDVFARFGPSVPSGTASLWILPGGYFGFDASSMTWSYLDHLAERRLGRAVLNALRTSPVHSTLALGVDTRRSPAPSSKVRQHAWIGQHQPGGRSLLRVARGDTSLAHRTVDLGPLNAAFFVCGEFTGSHTDESGPFFRDEGGAGCFLDDPVSQLAQCRLLVDLAHRQVSGSVSGACNRRMVHRRQMNRFAPQGAAALAHHHRGACSSGRAHFKHQSNWIMFRGGAWLAPSAVAEVW